MNYRDVLKVLSQCGIGAVIIDAEKMIHAANDSAVQLIHGDRNSGLIGYMLTDLAPELCDGTERYAGTVFGEYLTRCPSPDADGLPAGTELIVFRSASAEVQKERYEHALEQINDSVIVCDEKERISFLNNAAVRMDGLVLGDVIGEPIANVYEALDGGGLIIPRCIRERQVYLERRQYYTTRYHKNVDITANTFPVIYEGQVLGGYSLMKDWSTVDTLNKKIVELQEKLLQQRDRPEHQNSRSALTARYHFEDILHISPKIEAVLEQCRQAAKSDSSVMIYGETGTGKELLAQSIHNASRRKERPFLAINCAAIPENLLEGLLFGTEKGAFTGAERRQGLFEQAHGGTLLLDELNSMNVNLQAKLLRVLQDGKVRRVGGSREQDVDVRIISNLNISPQEAMERGILRRDLFYRLGVVNLEIPPLRDRKEDIPLLAKQFILRYNAKLSRNVRDADDATREMFLSYRWPGNVRELEHVIEHSINVLPDDQTIITPEFIPDYLTHDISVDSPDILDQTAGERQAVPVVTESLNRTMKDVERSAICRILKEHGGNISETARVLKMSRQSLQYRLRKYGIRVDEL